jgi:hypothetical protein
MVVRRIEDEGQTCTKLYTSHSIIKCNYKHKVLPKCSVDTKSLSQTFQATPNFQLAESLAWPGDSILPTNVSKLYLHTKIPCMLSVPPTQLFPTHYNPTSPPCAHRTTSHTHAAARKKCYSSSALSGAAQSSSAIRWSKCWARRLRIIVRGIWCFRM